jgi:hypothetical protein
MKVRLEKREAELKAAVMRELHAQRPEFMILLQGSAGAPDRAIAGNDRITTWEFKHATPEFVSPGLQELFCTRLAKQAHCRYVIWQEDRKGENKRTLIVKPRDILNRTNYQALNYEACCSGFDHRWLVRQILEAHGL